MSAGFAAFADALATFAAEFHFLRPWWLLGGLAIPALLWWLRRRRVRGEVWRSTVDPHLLPHLLADERRRAWRGALPSAAVALAATLAVLALAGPSWRTLPQPLWMARTPLVIAVDLSSAALATDVPPSRLQQSRAKIARILRDRAGGQIGLIAFANDAYTVTPLSDDAANAALFLEALAPDVMPRDGSRADRAIEEAVRLLERAGFQRGEILLITDRAGGAANSAAIEARSAGFRVSVLGLGTLGGGRYRARDGAPGVARLEDGALRTLALSGGGVYAPFAPGDLDLRTLGVLEAGRMEAVASDDRRGRLALDEGFWLLPPLLLLTLLAFRRGVLVVALLALWLPWRVEAADLWRREDQRAHAAMNRGVEAYRRGDYPAAEAAWRALPGAEAAYNRANALAKQGRYDEAIAEYDRALQLQPDMEDARENRRRVEAARRQQPPSSQPQQQRQQRQQQGQQQQRQSQQQQSQQQQPQQQQPQQQQPQQQQQRQQQDRQNQESPRNDRNPQDRPSPQNAPAQTPQQAQRRPPPASPARAQPTPATPAEDAARRQREQQQADAAQRERMQRARAAGERPAAAPPAGARATQRAETAAERERRMADEAWLLRVPDEPGGLLRAKFQLEDKRRRREGDR
jgi:Ca-activated chloride channel family protein